MDDPDLNGFAVWSPWVPLATALASAPREPGVYLVRSIGSDEVVYVGMAGLRDSGGTRTPRGLRGRLAFYVSGKALTSGLGEAVFCRALSDPVWIRERLASVEEGRVGDVREWGRQAIARANLEVCWAITSDRAAAVVLERAIIAALAAHGRLWNRRP